VPLVHVEHQFEGGPSVGRVLHVYPHEAASLPGVDHYLLQVPPAQVLVYVEPQARELHRDAARKLVRFEGVHDLLVLLELLRGVLFALGALAEDVHGRHAALLVQIPDGLYRLFEALAGHVATGDPAYYGAGDDGYGVGYRLVYYSHNWCLPRTYRSVSLSIASRL
jgi:hypothetical protein